MLAPYGGARSSEGGAQAPGAPPLDTPLLLLHPLMIMSYIETSPFSVLCDSGNDQIDRNFFAIYFCYWDQSQSQAVTRFLALPVCNMHAIILLKHFLSPCQMRLNLVEFHGPI